MATSYSSLLEISFEIEFPRPAPPACTFQYVIPRAIDWCRERTTPLTDDEVKNLVDDCVNAECGGMEEMRSTVMAAIGAYAIICRNVPVAGSIMEYAWNYHKVYPFLPTMDDIKFAFANFADGFSEAIDMTRGRIIREAVGSADLPLVKFLLSHGASVCHYDFDLEESVIGLAVENARRDGRLDILEVVLDRLEIDLGLNNPYVSFREIIKADEVEILEMFVEKDKLAEPGICYNIAVRYGSRKCMKLLE